MTAEELAQLKSKLLGLENGFSIKSAVPVDERFLMTKSEMLNVNSTVMPATYFTLCVEDGNLYVYNEDNVVDPITGKFRALTDIASLAKALRYVGTIENTVGNDPTSEIETYYTDSVPTVGDVLNLKNAFEYNSQTYPAGTNVVINKVTTDSTTGEVTFEFDPLGGIFDTTKVEELIAELIANSGHLTEVSTTATDLLPFTSLDKTEDNILNVTHNYGFLNKSVEYATISDSDVINMIFGPMTVSRALEKYAFLIYRNTSLQSYTCMSAANCKITMSTLNNETTRIEDTYSPNTHRRPVTDIFQTREGDIVKVYTPDSQEIEIIVDSTFPYWQFLFSGGGYDVAIGNTETKEVYCLSRGDFGWIIPCDDEAYIAEWGNSEALGL